MRTNSLLGVLTLNLGLSLVAGCTDSLEPATTPESTVSSAITVCYNFSAAAGPFVVGDVVTPPDSMINFQRFQWSNGMWTNGGIASVVASNFAAGTPVNELNLNNINARVVPNLPSTGGGFRYADLGGNVNFSVNGDFRNVADLDALNGTMVGGCIITVTRTNFAGGYRGVVTILPPAGVAINQFAVGGQEFYIDDLCF